MSLAVGLTDIYSLPGAARSDSPGWRNILRTPATKIAAEVFTLACLSTGLLSLFLGLSFL